jgi:hypothetical protein
LNASQATRLENPLHNQKLAKWNSFLSAGFYAELSFEKKKKTGPHLFM